MAIQTNTNTVTEILVDENVFKINCKIENGNITKGVIAKMHNTPIPINGNSNVINFSSVDEIYVLQKQITNLLKELRKVI